MAEPLSSSTATSPDAQATDALVELSGVTRRYQVGDVEVTALGGVDLTIGRGEFIVVLGPSGSGKTTLLNVVGALDSPTDGRRDRRRPGHHAGGAAGSSSISAVASVSFIFQTFNLFPALTALENVQFGIDATRRERMDRAKRPRCSSRSGWALGCEHFPHELSGGEQQRVAIARALATGNPILLADEPTGELDFRTGVQILELLHEQTHTSDRVGADRDPQPGDRAGGTTAWSSCPAAR